MLHSLQIDACKAVQQGTGELVPCLVENKDSIQNSRCKHVVSKLAQILFSDYRLLKDFYRECTDDVKKFQCGRVDALEEGVSIVIIMLTVTTSVGLWVIV